MTGLRALLPLASRGLLVLIAGWVLLLAWSADPLANRETLLAAHRAAGEPEVTVAASAAQAASDYPAIAAHPLFYASRQPWSPPPEPEPEAAPPSPSELTGYALVGLIMSGSQRKALIRPTGGGETKILSEGESLEGWTLQSIARDRLRFVAGKAEYDMSFPKPSGVGR